MTSLLTKKKHPTSYRLKTERKKKKEIQRWHRLVFVKCKYTKKKSRTVSQSKEENNMKEKIKSPRQLSIETIS
jgi:ABC-type uncharacterized transport system substrate-binding protein